MSSSLRTPLLKADVSVYGVAGFEVEMGSLARPSLIGLPADASRNVMSFLEQGDLVRLAQTNSSFTEDAQLEINESESTALICYEQIVQDERVQMFMKTMNFPRHLTYAKRTNMILARMKEHFQAVGGDPVDLYDQFSRGFEGSEDDKRAMYIKHLVDETQRKTMNLSLLARSEMWLRGPGRESRRVTVPRLCCTVSCLSSETAVVAKCGWSALLCTGPCWYACLGSFGLLGAGYLVTHKILPGCNKQQCEVAGFQRDLQSIAPTVPVMEREDG